MVRRDQSPTLIPAYRQLDPPPLATKRLSIERICDSMQFAALRPEWDALLDGSRSAIFTAWEWLYPWFHRIAPSRELEILAVRDEAGELVGIMPLCRQRRRVLGRAVRHLSFLGDSRVGSDYLDVVARRGFEDPVALDLATAIRDSSDWDVLDLFDLPEDSPTLSVFRAAFSGREFGARVEARFVCPYQTFAPDETFDRYLRRTSRRDNYLRRRRGLAAQPGFRIERESHPERLVLPLAEFFRLHELRWDGNSEGITGPDVQSFHRDAVLLLAERGQVRFYSLRIGDRAVASVYAILHGRKFIFYQSGYDPDWRSKSVGLVLLGETFRDCIETGFAEYDFLRGTEAYKTDWVTQRRRTVALRIFRRGGAGEWLDRQERAAAAARGIVKRVLPEPWVDAIRARRRRSIKR